MSKYLNDMCLFRISWLRYNLLFAINCEFAYYQQNQMVNFNYDYHSNWYNFCLAPYLLEVIQLLLYCNLHHRWKITTTE